MGNVERDLNVDKDVGPWIAFAIIIAANLIVYLMNERNWLQCLMCRCNKGWFLCITNRALGTSRDERPAHFLCWDLLDAKDLTTSRCIGTLGLLLYRVLCLAVFVFQMLWQAFGIRKLRENLDSTTMNFYTNWTFVLFGLSSLLGVLASWQAVRRERDADEEDAVVPYGMWSKGFHFVYMACTPSAGALTAFYWIVIYKGGTLTVDNVIKHGAAVGLLLLDLLLSRTPMVSYHAIVPIWYTSAYTLFLWLLYNARGTWVYKALDWNKTTNAIFYAAVVILIWLMCLLMHLLAMLREFFFTGRCGCCGRRREEAQFKASGDDGFYAHA